LAQQKEQMEAQAKMLRKLMKGKGKCFIAARVPAVLTVSYLILCYAGLSPAQRAEYERQQALADANAQLYQSLVDSMTSEQQRRLNAMTTEERAAQAAMAAKYVPRFAVNILRESEIVTEWRPGAPARHSKRRYLRALTTHHKQ